MAVVMRLVDGDTLQVARSHELVCLVGPRERREARGSSASLTDIVA